VNATSRTRQPDPRHRAPGTPTCRPVQNTSDGRAASIMTLRPVFVDPVNDTMSTRGSWRAALRHRGRWSHDVMTPRESRCAAISSPSTAADHGCPERFEHQGVSAPGRADLGQVYLCGNSRRDRADHTDGLTRHRAVRRMPCGRMTKIHIPRVGSAVSRRSSSLDVLRAAHLRQHHRRTTSETVMSRNSST